MKAFDWQLQKKVYIPMAGRIVDASLVPAPKQRNTEAEKAAIKAGKSARDSPDEPNKAAQKDTNARWTLKIGGKVRTRPGRHAAADDRGAGLRLQEPHQHRSQVRLHPRERGDGCLRRRRADAEAPRHDREHPGDVWADSSYRSRKNEKWLAGKMPTSRRPSAQAGG